MHATKKTKTPKHLKSVQIVPLHVTHTAGTAADTQEVRIGKGDRSRPTGLAKGKQHPNPDKWNSGFQKVREKSLQVTEELIKTNPLLINICGVTVQITVRYQIKN